MPLSLAIPIGMAAAGLFGQVLGGAKSGQAQDQAEGFVNKQVNDLTSWYDTEKNKDFLQSNIGSSAINKVLEDIETRNKTIESGAAVTGASDASVIAQKAKSQEQLSDTVKDLASYGTAREDRVEGRYRANMTNLMGQKTNIAMNKAQGWGNLVGAGGDLMGAAGGLVGQTKWGTKQNGELNKTHHDT